MTNGSAKPFTFVQIKQQTSSTVIPQNTTKILLKILGRVPNNNHKVREIIIMNRWEAHAEYWLGVRLGSRSSI